MRQPIKTYRTSPIKKNKKVETRDSLDSGNDTYLISLLLSIAALFISLMSVYFSHFHEDRTIGVSFVGADITSSSVTPRIIYHNRGNKSATIIENNIIFHQNEKDIKESGIEFTLRDISKSDSLEYDPLVVKERDQVVRNIKQPIYFEDAFSLKFNLKDTIKLSLQISYLDTDGLLRSSVFPIGMILLNDDYEIVDHRFVLFSENLYSNSYTTEVYKKPEPQLRKILK